MARGKKKPESEVIKASASIQIEGKATLLQRRAWNVLLANAYDELPQKERHTIPVQVLINTLEYNSTNQEYIKEALEALVGCRVKWNILDKDGETEWGVAALLAGAKISRGLCTYEYGSILREKLYNPRMYARLSLSVQNRFDSKHALALWELCIDYLGGRRDQGETPWIPLAEFRTLMGITEDMYPAFMRVNEKVIKPAIAEINRVSDFYVTVEYQRQGRKVTALKFKIRRVTRLLEVGTVQTKLFPEFDDMPTVVKELKDVGLSAPDSWDIYQKGFAGVQEDTRPDIDSDDDGAAFLQYVREKIHLLKRRQASGKVENATGFLLKAIKLNWSNPEFEIEVKKEAQREAAQVARDKEIRRKTLEAHKAQLEKARDNELQDACVSLVENEPDLLKEAAAWAMREVQGFMMLYDRGKSEAENYRDRHAVKALLNPYLRQQCPEYFHAIEKRHAPGISVIETQLQTL